MAVLPDPPWPESPFSRRESSNLRRVPQGTSDGNVDCSDVSNAVITCYPTSSTKVFQNTSLHVVWNANQPRFNQIGFVDIFLKHQDTLADATNQTNLPNALGRTSFSVNDSWWDARGNAFNGTDIDYPMFFFVVAHGLGTLGVTPQSTFTAIQTRLPDSIISLQAAASSASAASSSAALASLSSVLSTATAGVSGSPGRGAPTPSNTGSNGLQQNDGSGGFPAWAIALLVIFGTLALVFVLLAIWLGLRRYRRRGARSPKRGGSARESMGSHTPMMAEVAPTGHGDEPVSPGGVSSSQGHHSLIPPGALAIAGATGATSSSRAGSTHTKDTDVPFSGADAAIMAAAFRDTLRKPDFTSPALEEGESPDKEHDSEEEREAFLQRQFREEGRDLRSVASNKVKVQREGDVGDGASLSTIHGQGQGQGVSRDFDAPSVDSG